MTSIAALLAYAVVVLCTYSYGALIINRWMHLTRIDVIDVGNDLLDSPDVSEDIKDVVEAICASLNSSHMAWMLAIFLPLRTLSPTFWKSPKVNVQLTDREIAKKYRFVVRSGIPCVLANSPLAGVIVAIEVLILSMLKMPVGAALRALARDNVRSHGFEIMDRGSATSMPS